MLFRSCENYKAAHDSSLENKRMDTKGGKPWWGGDGGVLNWAIGIDMYTLMCIKLMTNKNLLHKKINRASLVAQWLGVRLLMQGTRVRALVWEDPTCRGATGPVGHNY